jgi:hypothetical protein
LRKCSDHGLTQNEGSQFTPKPCDFDYTEKIKNQKLMKKQNNIVPTAICHMNQVTVLTQMILQLKPSALTMKLSHRQWGRQQATLLNTLQRSLRQLQCHPKR